MSEIDTENMSWTAWKDGDCYSICSASKEYTDDAIKELADWRKDNAEIKLMDNKSAVNAFCGKDELNEFVSGQGSLFA